LSIAAFAQSNNNEAMNTQADHVLRTALSLDPNDRAEIAATLIASLDPQQEDDVDAAWAAEIARRIDSIDRGEVQLIPSEEVMRSMRERLNG
jgi:putative addiction module component (TIGR02574 family)